MEGVQTSTLDYSNYHHSSVPEESQDSLFHEFYQPRQGKQELINYSYESMADNSSSQTLSAFAFYPRGATIAAAIAAVIFIITGVIGKVHLVLTTENALFCQLILKFIFRKSCYNYRTVEKP